MLSAMASAGDEKIGERLTKELYAARILPPAAGNFQMFTERKQRIGQGFGQD